jgi:hypothetical protein
MPRNAIIAVSACLYVALSIWLVGRQGQAFREGLRSERSAVGKAEQPALLEPEPKHAAGEALDPEITAANSKSEGAPAVAVVDAPPEKRPREQGNPAGRAKDKAKAKRPGRAVADDAKKRAATKDTPLSDPLAADPFWNRPEMLKNWDVLSLSVSDEQKLGAQLHDVIVGLNPVASDGPWRQRLEEAAKPFLKTLLRKDIHYHFEVMESAHVNAFSHPGGYVYVNRGLFDLVGEDEDYALEFAVGNEMAHVDLEHAIKCLQDPDFKDMTGGTIRKLYWLILPLGYLENQDYEADEWTFSRMRSFGRSKRESLAFLNKLDGYASKHGFHDGRAKVRMAPDSSSFLDIHYQRQTAAWKRLEHLKDQIK